MAGTKATLEFADGTKKPVTITSGDKIRARRWVAEQKGYKPDEQEQLTYSAYLAAKRADLPHTEKEFLEFCDEVASLDLTVTEDMIAALEAAGEIDEKQAAQMRAALVTEEASDDAGEAQATPVS